MKKRILIYESNRETRGFFEDFFSGHPLYEASFAAEPRDLNKRLKDSPPDVLIASGSSIGKIKPDVEATALIATVSDVGKDLRNVVKHRVENYIVSPVLKEDLQYKLDIAAREKSHLDVMLRDKKHIETVLELTYLVSSSLNPEEILYFVVRKLSEIIDVTRCSMISLGSTDDSHVTVVSTHEDPSIRNLRLDLRKYPEINKALRTKEPVVVRDAMKDPLMKAVAPLIKPIGIKSIIVLPVVFRNEVIGTLFLRTSTKGHIFTEKEITLCRSIANASATALNNSFLFEKLKAERARLEKLAITDFLTGVYNTRYFYHRLEEEFIRAQRYGSHLSCLMMDIDHFKKINDTYGHRVGDMVLREFAATVKKHTRKSDVFARYGGEEFILLLPHTNSSGAVAEGERIKRMVRGHRYKDIKGRQKITVSIGIVTYPLKKIRIQDDLIRLADDALLSAKNSGRDRIVVSK